MVGGAYHKIQIVSSASAKITLNNGISTQVENILKWVRIQGCRRTMTRSPLNPSLVNKNKLNEVNEHINLMNVMNSITTAL